MKIQIGRFELGIGEKQKTLPATTAASGGFITHLPASSAGWWPVIRESFAGAWQRGTLVQVEDALAHPTYWSCVTLIAGDIAKIRPMLVKYVEGIAVEQADSPLAAVLARPNHYQNRIQFLTYWLMSKLMRGNAYALKARDKRGVVTDLYLLDPLRVRPLVSPTGQVYYACQQDLLAELTEASIVVPASEIIHDIGFAPYHPLCGFSPVYACGHAAMQALTIVNNATRLFKNGSQVGGVMTAPGQISADTAKRLEDYWQANYAGEQNIGKVAVLGDGLKFEKPTVMSAVDAQLIDQLKWDDEKICSVHHVPGFMVGVGPLPAYNNVEALGIQYYSQCLQYYFESVELCLTEGLELPKATCVEFDVAALDRLDSSQQMEVATKSVIGGIRKPNEARALFRLGPVPGGDRVYLQKQNWPLEDLGADAVAPMPPPAPAPAPVPPAPAKAFDPEALRARVLAQLEASV